MPSPGFREGQPERRAAGSERPSGAVAAPALLWPPLGSENAALVPKKEPKPPPIQSLATAGGAYKKARERGARAVHFAQGFARHGRGRSTDRPDAGASPSPSFLCVCAWRRNY